MRNQEWHTTTAELNALDLAQLVLGLLVLDAVDGEAALGVVDEAEVLARLLDGDDVHEAGGEGHVGADLAVDLDEALHQDGPGLAVVERILEAVADEDDQGHALAELMRTGRRARGIDARQLVEKPVRRRAEALLVLLTVAHELAWRHFDPLGQAAAGQRPAIARFGETGSSSIQSTECSRQGLGMSRLGVLTVLYPSWLLLSMCWSMGK